MNPTPAQWREAARRIAEGKQQQICPALWAQDRDLNAYPRLRQIRLLLRGACYMRDLYPGRMFSPEGTPEERSNVRVLACLFLALYEEDQLKEKSK